MRVSKLSTMLLIALLWSGLLWVAPHTLAATAKWKYVVLSGRDANELFISIKNYTNDNVFVYTSDFDKADLIIVSGEANISREDIVNALQRGSIFVIIGESQVNSLHIAPLLTFSSQKVELKVNATSGVLISSNVIEEVSMGIRTPEYSICVIHRSDSVISLSYYAVMVDSPYQFNRINEYAGEKVALLLESDPSDTELQSLTSTSTSEDWQKVYELNYLWVLNEYGDQLKIRYEIYQLKYWDDVVYKEYWRVDPTIDHLIKTYKQETFHCGPYMNQRKILVDALSAELYDYDPTTTAEDVGASVNIGFTVNTGGVGLGISYSWSWDNPGVKYDALADYANSDITWVETFRGPDYFWWPLYAGPTSAAYNSYIAKPSVVMRTPVGTGFDLSLLNSTWVTYDDDLTFIIIGIIYRTITTYSLWWNNIDLASIFMPPSVPSTPSGPTLGYRNIAYSYSTSTIDPNGDLIYYEFDWGDGSYTLAGPYASGATATATHSYSSIGTYYIRVRAKDPAGLWSGWSSPLAVTIINRAPNTPSTPSGPTSGYTGTSYSYSTSTTDPDGDSVCYQFDWGDGSTTTTSYYSSGSTVYASHTWSSAGTYYVKVRAKDSYGAWSDWSSSLTVTISTSSGGGGGGGCPTLFSWNGSGYVEEALLDIHASEDVTVDYTLKYLKPAGSLCMLSLRELDNYTSHIDYVKLYVVDAEGNWHECRLILALHNKLGLVTTQLSSDDDTRIDLKPSQRIELLFTLPKGINNIQHVIFELNGYNRKLLM